MKYLFLLLGLFLIVVSGAIVFLKPGVPQPIEILAMLFMVGGFVLLGVAQILKALSDLKTARP
jgi:hypothetical protein